MSGDHLFAPIFTSDELSDATGDRAWLQALLDAEAALARSEADCGVIPEAAAEIIPSACRAEDFDPLAWAGPAARAATPSSRWLPPSRPAATPRPVVGALGSNQPGHPGLGRHAGGRANQHPD